MFVVGIFIVVIGLRNQGFAHVIGGVIEHLAGESVFRMLRARGAESPIPLYVRIGIPVTLLAVALCLLTLNLEWLIVARLSD